MYLQHGTRADILARTQRLGETSVKLAPRTEPAGATPRETASSGATPAEPDPDVVRAIQRELAHRGYSPGPADGLVHPVTRAAVMAYEHDHGLALTGEPSEELLKSILFGLPASAGSAPAGDPQPQAQNIIRSVQQSLAALGYRITKIDGRLGEETAQAIRTFETQHRMTPSGRISGGLLQELDKATVRQQRRAAAR